MLWLLPILLQVCPNPPFFANGSWCGWATQMNQINNATDPISAIVGVPLEAVQVIVPIFLGALYVFLYFRFTRSPARFKFVAITALVMVVSIIFAGTGLYGGAVLNVMVFAITYPLSYLFDRSR